MTISPSFDFYQRQLELLRQRNARLAAQVATAPTDWVRADSARSGAVTGFVVIDGKPAALHSSYDPVREAEQFVDSQKTSPSLAHALIGPGLGYVAQSLHRRLPPSTPLILFEGEPAVLRAALSTRDLTDLLLSPRVIWFGDEPRSALFEQLLSIAEVVAEGMAILVPPVSARRCGEYAERMRAVLDDAQQFARMSLTTTLTQGRRTIGNLVGNLVRYGERESLAPWRGRWSGYPALVISAGPSLARNRHLIPQAQGKMLLVSVGTAYKQLLALGVAPDLVVHIDHSDLCLRHFQGIGDPGSTILVADPYAAPVVLDTWPGRMAMTQNAYADHLIGPPKREMAAVAQGATVAHTAFYLAQFLGANPIVLVGQDLAFTDGVYYSSGIGLHELWQPELNRFHTVETKEWERLVRRKSQLVMVADSQGRPVFSDRQMLNYLRQFESDFARSPTTVIDATEGGAAKQGTRPMPLAEALAQFAGEPFPAERTQPDGECRPIDSRQIYRSLRAARSRASGFQRVCGEIGGLQRRVLSNWSDVDRRAKTLNQMSGLQRKIQREYATEFQIAATLDGSLEVEKNRKSRQIDSMGLEGDALLRAYLERDIVYVAGLQAAVGELAELLLHEITKDSSSTP